MSRRCLRSGMSSVSVSGLCCCVQRVLNLQFSFLLISLLGHCFIHPRSDMDIGISPFPLRKTGTPKLPASRPSSGGNHAVRIRLLPDIHGRGGVHLETRAVGPAEAVLPVDQIQRDGVFCVFIILCVDPRWFDRPRPLTRSVMRYGGMSSKQRVSRAG